MKRDELIGVDVPWATPLQMMPKPKEVMRWTGPDSRCEIWTGKRWIDLEELVAKLEALAE